MAKAKNIYAKESVPSLKEGIDFTIEYLSGIIPEEAEDDIQWVAAAKGGMYPKPVVTIEEIFKTSLTMIRDCCQQLLIVHGSEGMTDYILEQTEFLKAKMAAIKAYYNLRPVSMIVHRMITMQQGGGTNKNGTAKPVKTIELLVATKQRQIIERLAMHKSMSEIAPFIDRLNDLQESLEVKGDYDIPESFLIRDLV